MITTQQQKQLVKRYHTLADRLKMSDGDKLQFLLQNYGRESSLELTKSELVEACKLLSNILNENADMWRKRVIAAISGYLKKIHYEHDMAKIKAIACRATSCKSFNTIPLPKLRDVYAEFVRKQKVNMNTETIKQELINLPKHLN